MEQTNLVVTADGKTWDEVTRDTSYIGKVSLTTTTNGDFTHTQNVIFDEWRGDANQNNGPWALSNKDFAIAYDRVICLKNGYYQFSASTLNNAQSDGLQLFKNGTVDATHLIIRGHNNVSTYGNLSWSIPIHCVRGDYFIMQGKWQADTSYSKFHITRL